MSFYEFWFRTRVSCGIAILAGIASVVVTSVFAKECDAIANGVYQSLGWEPAGAGLVMSLLPACTGLIVGLVLSIRFPHSVMSRCIPWVAAFVMLSTILVAFSFYVSVMRGPPGLIRLVAIITVIFVLVYPVVVFILSMALSGISLLLFKAPTANELVSIGNRSKSAHS